MERAYLVITATIYTVVIFYLQSVKVIFALRHTKTKLSNDLNVIAISLYALCIYSRPWVSENTCVSMHSFFHSTNIL